MKRSLSTNNGVPGLRRATLTGKLAIAACILTSTAFVVNVNDGTFLKPLILYACCGMIATVVCIRTIDLRRFPYPLSRLHLLFLLYLAAGAVSFLAATSIRLGIEALIRQCCYFILIFAAFERLNARTFVASLMILTAGVSCVALAYLIFPYSSPAYEFAKQLANISTFGNQSYFAGFLVLVIPLIAAEILLCRESGKSMLLRSLLLAAALYLLVMTESRSAWGAVIVSLVLLAACVFRKKNLLFGSLAALCCVLAVLFFTFRSTIEPRILLLFDPGPHSSIMRRIFFYEGAWKAFLASPIWGNGIGNFILFLPGFRSPDYWMFRSEDVVPHAHSEFFEILSETGLLGFCCFVFLIGYIIVTLLRRQRPIGGNEGILLAGFLASICGVLLDNLWSMNLRTVPVAASFWVACGVALQFLKSGETPPGHSSQQASIPVTLAVACVALFGMYFLFTLGVQRYSTESLYLEGLLLQTQSHAEEASLKFEEVLRIDPHHPESRFYLSTDLVQRGDYAQASRNIDALLAECPNYPKAGTLSAICAHQLGDTTKAEASMRRELSINRSPQSLYYASLLSRGRGREEAGYLVEILSSNIASGLKDFAIEALNRLHEIPTGDLPEKTFSPILISFRDKFADDSSLLHSVGLNMRRLGEDSTKNFHPK